MNLLNEGTEPVQWLQFILFFIALIFGPCEVNVQCEQNMHGTACFLIDMQIVSVSLRTMLQISLDL